jgi:hypothetical protein
LALAVSVVRLCFARGFSESRTDGKVAGVRETLFFYGGVALEKEEEQKYKKKMEPSKVKKS